MLTRSGWLYFHEKDDYFPKMAETGLKQATRRIGILPLDHFALMSYAACVEPLRAANLLSQKPLYEVINISPDGLAVGSSGQAFINCQATTEADLNLDYLFVIAGGDPTKLFDTTIMYWLQRLARFGVRIGGVSGGPLILAKAGLMDGRRMTVHWEHAEALAEVSPSLLIERSLYVIDRDRVTCAGGLAAMDMMHALISQHHGAMFARMVSDWFLHTDIRPSAGPQRGGLVERVGTTNAAILDAVAAMEHHIADPLGLPQLATVSGVSSRQLNRLFRDHLNTRTMAYYRRLRLEKADNLLRNSSLSLTEIALATGFASSSHFSSAYRGLFGRPPSAPRARLAG